MAEGGNDDMGSFKPTSEEGEDSGQTGDLETDTVDFRKVLDRLLNFLKEYLGPEETLDAFQQHDLVRATKIRDIRERTTTTEKNRDIIGVVRRGGRTFYNKFKRILQETNQGNVVRRMKETEAELSTVTMDMDNARDGDSDGESDDNTENIEEDSESEDSENGLGKTILRSTNNVVFRAGINKVIYRRVPDLSDDELKKRDFQARLVELYEQHYTLVPFCPLIKKEQIPFEDLYVPRIVKIKKKSGVDVKDEEILKIEDLMVDGDSPVKRIYLTAHAGMGKTSYCYRLIRDWCVAHSQNQESGEVNPDQLTMKRFDFLFYIQLRDTQETNVIEMIKKSYLPYTGHRDTLEHVLAHESDKCLIILDGLDEWEASQEISSQFSCPGIPDVRCVLTTSRHWKLEAVEPPPKYLDIETQLQGLSKTLSQQLAETIVRYRNKNTGKNKECNDFFEELNRNNMDHMAETPILLAMLCFLWHEDGSIGDSLCNIYSSMINLLFDVDECRRRISSLEVGNEDVQGRLLPGCFEDQGYFYTYFNIIQCLSTLAFEALFSDNQEKSLVFPRKRARNYGLNRRDLELCFHVGILSESEVLGKRLSRQTKISFVHKTIQEFFAALHVALQDGHKLASTLDVIRKMCCSLDRVHEFSEVFVFLSGMLPDVSFEVSKHIGQLADANPDILYYRHFSTRGYEVAFAIQQLVIRCIKESHKNGFESKFVIHDVVFLEKWHALRSITSKDDMCALARQEYAYLNFIDTHYVRSVTIRSWIRMDSWTFLPSEVIEFSNILSNLIKIDIGNGGAVEKLNDEISSLLDALFSRSSETLECLDVNVDGLSFDTNDRMVHLFDTCFRSLHKLRSFSLQNCSVTHGQYTYLADFLSTKTDLEQIDIGRLQCRSSDGHYGDIKLNLSSHDRLRYLYVINYELQRLKCVVELPSNGAEMSWFEMHGVTPLNCSSFFKSLLGSTNLTVLKFRPLEKVSTSLSSVLLDSVVTWTHLDTCSISNITMDNYQLLLHNNKRLSGLALENLQMPVESLCLLIDSIPQTDEGHIILTDVELYEQKDVQFFLDHISGKGFDHSSIPIYSGTCLKYVFMTRNSRRRVFMMRLQHELRLKKNKIKKLP